LLNYHDVSFEMRTHRWEKGFIFGWFREEFLQSDSTGGKKVIIFVMWCKQCAMETVGKECLCVICVCVNTVDLIYGFVLLPHSHIVTQKHEKLEWLSVEHLFPPRPNNPTCFCQILIINGICSKLDRV